MGHFIQFFDKLCYSKHTSTIGFWFEHKEYSTSTYADYAVSVNDIESWTGLDLFANLPDSIEETVEANSNWTAFQNF